MKKIMHKYSKLAFILLLFFIGQFCGLDLSWPQPAFGAQSGQQINKKATTNAPNKLAFIKPWSEMTVSTEKITIYPDRIEPSDILTINFIFGNAGTEPIENVTIVCLPPNKIVPFIETSYVFWDQELYSGPIEIGDPVIKPNLAAGGNLAVDSIFWKVDNIPIDRNEAEKNRIEFNLKVDISKIEISQDLLCWVGIFYSDNLKAKPMTFKSVNIWAEVKPKLEILKRVEKKSILPGESIQTFLLIRNNSKFDTDHVVVIDSS